MDTILPEIMMILSKYAPDKGASLADEVGLEATRLAGEIFNLALTRLRQTPKGQVLADGFEQDPQTYSRPVELELNTLIQHFPEFRTKLKHLLARYQRMIEGLST